MKPPKTDGKPAGKTNGKTPGKVPVHKSGNGRAPAGMRIIAGQWRGRRLVAPVGDATRPTADRARETLFSMLTSRLGGFTDLRVADLFAGSGALGLEALSRGAASCLFVENDRAAAAAIEGNIAALSASGATLRHGSALSPATMTEPFDLILIDPPYAQENVGDLLDLLVDKGWTSPATIISVETGSKEAPCATKLDLLVSRGAGKAQLHLFQPR
jgi:16S rRNA (guanine966-N2)-methyltransferase